MFTSWKIHVLYALMFSCDTCTSCFSKAKVKASCEGAATVCFRKVQYTK